MDSGSGRVIGLLALVLAIIALVAGGVGIAMARSSSGNSAQFTADVTITYDVR